MFQQAAVAMPNHLDKATGHFERVGVKANDLKQRIHGKGGDDCNPEKPEKKLGYAWPTSHWLVSFAHLDQQKCSCQASKTHPSRSTPSFVV